MTATPPANLHGHHYAPVLQAYVLHQYHGCSVTQPELLDWLWDIGLSISSRELSQLLTQGHEQFHAEKAELLATGIRCSAISRQMTREQGIKGRMVTAPSLTTSPLPGLKAQAARAGKTL